MLSAINYGEKKKERMDEPQLNNVTLAPKSNKNMSL